jgi:hypothetical protein
MIDLTYSEILARRMPERRFVGARTLDERELSWIPIITAKYRRVGPSQRPSDRVARAGTVV